MRRAALIESLVNVGLGYIVSVLLAFTILPLWGHAPSFGDSLGFGLVFTFASIARNYAVRRFFQRKWQ